MRSRHGQARCLASTVGLDRQAWLAIRQRGIGSSDAAAAVGLSPYKSPLTLWLEKTGRQLPEDVSGKEAVVWGTVLEPVLARVYAERTGRRVRRVNAVLQHPEHPWMLANIDREVTGAPDVQILECKTAGIHGSRLWRDGVPEYVQLQVMHQLAVTGKQAADVAVLLGGQHLEIHRIERDDRLIARLIDLERQFWQYVENDTPPPADGSDSAESALRCLYPDDTGQTVDFRDHRNLSACFADLLAVRQSIAEQEKLEARLKQTLQQAMGNATRADFETGSVSWKKAKDSVVLDVTRLLKDQPDLQQRYALTKAGSRRFLVL